jgi:hypothetical protein
MSAASSGFILPYKIIQPTEADLAGIEKGRLLHYKEKMCGTPQKLFSNWWISKIKDNSINVTPLRGLIIGGALTISRSLKTRHFTTRLRKVCK